MPIQVISSGSVSDITGFTAVGVVRFGANGADPLVWETAVGTSSSISASDNLVWDEDISSGLDSNWVSAQFDVAPGGGTNAINWTVTGGVTVPLSSSCGTFSGIQKAIVRAVVLDSGHAMNWRLITAKFYKEGQLRETLSHRSGPGVDTRFGSATLEQYIEITPTASDNDRMLVTGQFRMESPSSSISEDMIQGQVYLFA